MRDVTIWAGEVRAVVLDVDGTLYHQAPVRRAMMARLLRAHWRRPRSALGVTRMLSAYRRAQESLRSSAFEGDVTAAQLGLAAERSGADPAAVRSCVEEWMETAPLDLVAASIRDGLVDALDEMSASGVKLAVVSDYPAERKLRALGIVDRFDVVVSAQDDRVQAFKPNPRGIQTALDDLGVHASAALYVGDRHDVDAPAAAALDMRCVLVGSDRSQTDDHRVRRVGHFSQLVELVVGG